MPHFGIAESLGGERTAEVEKPCDTPAVIVFIEKPCDTPVPFPYILKQRAAKSFYFEERIFLIPSIASTLLSTLLHHGGLTPPPQMHVAARGVEAVARRGMAWNAFYRKT